MKKKNHIPPQIFNASDLVFQVTHFFLHRFDKIFFFSLNFRFLKFFVLIGNWLKKVSVKNCKNVKSWGQNNLVKLMGICVMILLINLAISVI